MKNTTRRVSDAQRCKAVRAAKLRYRRKIRLKRLGEGKCRIDGCIEPRVNVTYCERHRLMTNENWRHWRAGLSDPTYGRKPDTEEAENIRRCHRKQCFLYRRKRHGTKKP